MSMSNLASKFATDYNWRMAHQVPPTPPRVSLSSILCSPSFAFFLAIAHGLRTTIYSVSIPTPQSPPFFISSECKKRVMV